MSAYNIWNVLQSDYKTISDWWKFAQSNGSPQNPLYAENQANTGGVSFKPSQVYVGGAYSTAVYFGPDGMLYYYQGDMDGIDVIQLAKDESIYQFNEAQGVDAYRSIFMDSASDYRKRALTYLAQRLKDGSLTMDAIVGQSNKSASSVLRILSEVDPSFADPGALDVLKQANKTAYQNSIIGGHPTIVGADYDIYDNPLYGKTDNASADSTQPALLLHLVANPKLVTDAIDNLNKLVKLEMKVVPVGSIANNKESIIISGSNALLPLPIGFPYSYGAPTGTTLRDTFNADETTSISATPTQAQVIAVQSRLTSTRQILAAIITDFQRVGLIQTT